jgi:hypothetical protein
MCYILLTSINVLYWYTFILYWCDAFLLAKQLKQLRCMVYTNCFTICVEIVINKQTNKWINNSLSITEKCRIKNKNKTFINAFDITKKCYKLACMDGVKTWAIVPFQYSVKTWWKVV